jgi:hypothetical protein
MKGVWSICLCTFLFMIEPSAASCDRRQNYDRLSDIQCHFMKVPDRISAFRNGKCCYGSAEFD